MKRSLFVLTILLLSFGLANAVNFRVEAGPEWEPGKLNANAASYIEIYAENTAGEGARMGYSWPVMIYGDASPITYLNMGGIAATGGALVINPNFAPTGSWLPSINSINIFSPASWDGNLPDTFNHTTTCIPITGCPGWADNLGELLIYTIHFQTPDGTVGVPMQICVDSIKHSNPTYDWLWSPLSGPFGGPYCFTVEKAPDLPPTAVDCPTVDIELQWNDQVSVDIEWTDDKASELDDATVDVGDVTFSGFTTTWTFNPTCSDVGSHTVTICATDNQHTCPTGEECVFTVSVLNTIPTISGDCGKTIACSIVGTATASFIGADVNGDVPTINLVSDDGTGAASIVGGVVTFDGAVAGEGTWEVVVQAEDCAGGLSLPCSVFFDVVSELPYHIMITKEEGVLQGHHRLVDIVKTFGTNDMYGFDFVIAYDASALSFYGAVPGVLFDMPGTYEWEYFTYRFGANGNCGNACPSGLLEVVGLADQNDGPNHPDELNIPNGTVLFSLDFLVSNDRTYECQYVPIRFFWTQCSDNTIAYHSSVALDPLEILLAVSDTVWNYVSTGVYLDITDPNYEYGFPTYYGVQIGEGCLEGEPGKPGPQQFISFYNGGIDIICADEIDDRGDINLNGISNEIADAVVFTNYFIYGLSAFTVNEEGQMAATDVNADGIILSVADLVYLIRVIVGDALPYDKLTPFATEATFAYGNGMVSTNAEVGAALFTFEGNADVTLAPGVAMDLKVGTVDGMTKALVYNIGKEVVSGNVLVTDGKLVSVEAVDYNGSAYKVDVLPNTFVVNQNYPNPFNPMTTMEFSLPMQSDWTVTIFNVAGQTVETIRGNGVGLQTITWDATNNASGIYFYKVEANNQSVTKKMVLLK